MSREKLLQWSRINTLIPLGSGARLSYKALRLMSLVPRDQQTLTAYLVLMRLRAGAMMNGNLNGLGPYKLYRS